MRRSFMNRWLKTLFKPRQGCYVVIYDHGQDIDAVIEEYYGYFCSIEEAEQMYGELSADQPDYHNARICKVVKAL